MRVGIVNFYRANSQDKGIQPLLSCCDVLGIDVEVYPYDTPDLPHIIGSSPLTHWIFSGSNQSVLTQDAPHVPLEILSLKKEFLLICYSMESLLMQLGAKVRRGPKRKEFFHLGDQFLYRNHYGYIPVSSFPPKATLLSSYKGEVMTARFKHCLMTQWHPERTADGYLFLIGWLNKS